MTIMLLPLLLRSLHPSPSRSSWRTTTEANIWPGIPNNCVRRPSSWCSAAPSLKRKPSKHNQRLPKASVPALFGGVDVLTWLTWQNSHDLRLKYNSSKGFWWTRTTSNPLTPLKDHFSSLIQFNKALLCVSETLTSRSGWDLEQRSSRLPASSRLSSVIKQMRLLCNDSVSFPK